MADDKIDYDALMNPLPDDENDRLQKFKKMLAEHDKNRNTGVTIFGVQARNSQEWGKQMTPDDIIKRRIEAGLDVYPYQYTEQDMIDFANKAIYAYIGNALIVDSGLKLNTDWLKDNLW